MPEFMGYDRAIVTFSPDGRLFQVEYAKEAVKRGTTSVGVTFSEGTVLVALRPLGPLAIPNSGSDKVHEIDSHVGAVTSGFLADGRTLIDLARIKAQVYKLTYDEPISVLMTVKEVADRMQLFTQYGGVRPFGVALLFGGVDEKGPQLFEVDPSSAYFSWKAHAIGRGSIEAIKVLRKKWKPKMKENDAIKLALSALKAGEKVLKLQELEIAIIKANKFKKWYGEEAGRFLKKFI